MVTEENIEELLSIVDNLSKRFKFYSTNKIEVKVGMEKISLPFSTGDYPDKFTIDEFIELGFELTNFDVAKSRIYTTTRMYCFVKMDDEQLEYYLRKMETFFIERDKIELRIGMGDYWLSLAFMYIGLFENSPWSKEYSTYTVLELTYTDPNSKRLNYDEETQLIYSYLYEIADTTGYVFYPSKIPKNDVDLEKKISRYWDDDYGRTDYEGATLKPLLGYSEVMRLYISALQSSDPELSLLSFYKIFEYFAPIVINLESYEQLSKKLDSPSVLKPNRTYLKSIFDLVDSSRQRLRDSELIKAVINKCFDLIDIFEYLPNSIQKRILSHIQEQQFSYALSKEKRIRACNYLGTILYSTRNQVAHAKSNFLPTGDECPIADIETLNIFFKKATSLTIRWYDRLPNYQKE